jgi:hypothetical protein
MIFSAATITSGELERATGWRLEPQGLCHREVCVPAPGLDPDAIGLGSVAERLGMTVAHDEVHGLWALGPRSGGRTLETAQAPDLVLSDLEGNAFELRSLRGQKVFLLAWASW